MAPPSPCPEHSGLVANQVAHREALEDFREDFREDMDRLRFDIREGFTRVTESINRISDREDKIEGRLLTVEVKQVGSGIKVKALWGAAAAILTLVGGFVWRLIVGG